MRPKCHFKNNGKPTTLPGTDDDAKRIALSEWLTAVLVRHGDEAEGDYQTPGANGYAAWEVAEAKKRLAAHKPTVRKPKERFDDTQPMGKRVKPRAEPVPQPPPVAPPVPRHAKGQVLSERFGQLGQQLGRANKRIKSLTKPD